MIYSGLGGLGGMGNMQQAQQQLMQDPEMMRQLLDSPMMQVFLHLFIEMRHPKNV